MENKIIIVILCLVLMLGSFITILDSNKGKDMNESINNKGINSNRPQWPNLQYDNKNSGICPYDTTYNDGSKRWGFNTSDWIQYSPTIASDGTIYVGSHSSFYALNQDGTKKWSIDLSGMVTSEPVIAPSGIIYITESSGNLIAVNANGSVEWVKNIASPHNRSPKIGSDGTIYISSGYGTLYALDSEGNEKWNFTTNIGTSTPCISSEGMIYIVSDAKKSGYWKLYAINSNGTENWNTTIEAYSVISAPTIGPKNRIYFGTMEGDFYAVGKNGEVKWTKQLGNTIWCSPAITPDGTIYVGTRENNLFALNSDGLVKWSFSTGDDILSSPVVSKEGTIYIGSYNNKFYALNPNGTEKWSFETDGVITASPAINKNGTIYVGSKDGFLYGIGSHVTNPTKPKNLELSSKDKKIELSWNPPDYDGGKRIKGYKIYRGKTSDNLKFLETENSTSYIDGSIDYDETYYYKVCAYNSVGEGESSDVISVTLEDRVNPTADAGNSKTVKVDEEVTFDASGSSDNVDITTYEWDFDDGTTATGKTVEHKFDEKGTYEVKLTVTDEAGNTDTDIVTVTVEKEDDNGGNGIPGFSIILLSISLSFVILYQYRRRTD